MRDEEVTQWVRGTIRALMAKRRMTYAELTARLNAMGVDENERNLRNKVMRATFSATFFVQLLLAIGLDTLHLDVRKVMEGPEGEREFASETPWKPTKKQEAEWDRMQASLRTLLAEIEARQSPAADAD